MKLILTGATGFAGAEVLRQALADPSIERVTVLTRRSLGLTHAKLREVIVADFLEYDRATLADADACIWCLGVAQSAVSEAEYIRITHDYAVTALKAMLAVNLRLRFCFVSGFSADPGEQARSLQARIKGRTELALSRVAPANVFNFRPGYIAASTGSGPRKDFGRYAAPIAWVMGLFIKDFKIECDQLARCLIDVARNGASEHLLMNKTIIEWRVRRS
jgi:uncharacterized protein YbjT (DUF2867 family)